MKLFAAIVAACLSVPLAAQVQLGKGVSVGSATGGTDGITALTGDVTAAGPGTTAASLAAITTAGTCGDATHVSQITKDAKGRVTGCTPVAITAGSGSVIPSPQFRTSYFPTAGTVGTVQGDVNSTTDGNGTHSFLGYGPINPLLPLLRSGPHMGYAQNYQHPNQTAKQDPWHYSYFQSVRPPGGFGVGPFTYGLDVQGGGENLGNLFIDYAHDFTQVNIHTAGQLGGTRDVFANCWSIGDCTGDQWQLFGNGGSRGTDEFTAIKRYFVGATNANWGGAVAISSPLSTGDVPLMLTPGSGYNVINTADTVTLIDITRRTSAGNVTNAAASDGVLIKVTLDTAHSFGTSIKTATTQPIDSTVYTGTCPTHTATGSVYPQIGPQAGIAIDGYTLLENGTGVPQINANYVNAPGGALVGFCVTVGSTAGMSAGQTVEFTSGELDLEYTKIIAVADGTHFTAFMHHQHPTGTIVTVGGGVGWGLGMAADELPAGTLSNGVNNFQTAPIKLVYPIAYCDSSTTCALYVNSAGVGGQEFKTRAFATTTPLTPMTITPTVVGGVVTAVSTNANNYISSTIIAGAPFLLPPPPVTTTGCTVAPVFGFTLTTPSNQSLYTPNIVSGGSGCVTPTVTVGVTPNPAYFVPITMAVSVIDVTQAYPDPPNAHRTDTGYVLVNPFVSAVVNGDVIAQSQWWNRFSGRGQTRLDADPIVGLSGKPQQGEWIRTSNLGNGQANFLIEDGSPTTRSYSDFAHNWQPTTSIPGSGQIVPGPVFQIEGLNNRIELGLPPTANSRPNTFAKTGTGPGIGSTWLLFNCRFLADAPAGSDHPCLHGQYDPFAVFGVNFGPSQSSFWTDPNNGALNWTGGISNTSSLNSNILGVFGGNQKWGSTGFTNAGNPLVFDVGGGFTPARDTGNNSTVIQHQIQNLSVSATWDFGVVGSSGFNACAGGTFAFALDGQAPVACFGNANITLQKPLSVSSSGASTFQLGANLFSALPACSGLEGMQAPVSDSTTNTSGATITGSGSNHVNAYCNGTNWVVMSGVGTGGGMVYPSGSGIPIVVSGTSWGTTVAAPTGTIVGTTDTQTLTNKTLDGVTPATMAFVDPTSSIQTQLNGKQATLLAKVTTTVGTTAIGANTCASAVTVTMTGLASTNTLSFTPNADVSAITGWGATGGLTIDAWPTTNTVNYKVCNQTASSITPSGSVTFNVSAQ